MWRIILDFLFMWCFHIWVFPGMIAVSIKSKYKVCEVFCNIVSILIFFKVIWNVEKYQFKLSKMISKSKNTQAPSSHPNQNNADLVFTKINQNWEVSVRYCYPELLFFQLHWAPSWLPGFVVLFRRQFCNLFSTGFSNFKILSTDAYHKNPTLLFPKSYLENRTTPHILTIFLFRTLV